MDREELILIALANTKGIGRRRLHRILADGMCVEELLDAAEKGDSTYWGEPALSSLRETYSGNAGKMAEQCVGEGKRIAFMCEQKNIKIVTAMNDDYPARLRGITDAPILLYVKGNLPREDKPAVAMIGARACSAYGKAVAHSFAGELAVRGVQIISGMARGIDGIGQESAVNAGGETFAVLGNGADICYPKEHRGLYDAILTRGGIISEYLPGTDPQPAFFPERNRIISGLSDLVLVVEARKRSGTYITVTQALEQGREVYAVPGRVTDALSDGCNVLIKDGAGIADSVSGIMEALAGAQAEAYKLVDVDSAYSYTYIDVNDEGKLAETTYRLYGLKNATTGEVTLTKFGAGFADETNADTLAAQVDERTINQIAYYENGILKSGKLADDKAYLASFTTEVKAFLDTIAAKAEADTLLKKNSDDAIKAWKEALAKFNGASSSKEISDALTAAQAAQATFVANMDTAKTAAGKKSVAEAFRSKLNAYYTAAKKNGMTFNKVALPVYSSSIDGSQTVTGVSKGVDEWLSDATNGATYLLWIYDGFEVSGTKVDDGRNVGYFLNKTTGDTPAAETETITIGTTKNLATSNTYAIVTGDQNLEQALKTASEKAFGPAKNYIEFFGKYVTKLDEMQGGYLHTQPSEADVRALYKYYNIQDIAGVDKVWEQDKDADGKPLFDKNGDPVMIETDEAVYPYGALGAYGKYLYAEDDDVEVFAKNYKAIMANLEGAIAYWEAKYAILNAKLVAWKDGKKVADKAVADYRYANIDNASTKAGEIRSEMTEVENIVEALNDLIDVYLPLWMKDKETGKVSQMGDYSSTSLFMEKLEGIIKLQQANVRSYERKLANAKYALELHKTDSYNKLTEAELELNAAIGQLEYAQAELDKALAELAKALEIAAAATSAE